MSEAIFNVIFENVLNTILGIISIVVSCYLIPFIKNDLVSWLKEKRLYSMVKKFVQAAEKLAEAGTIKKVDKPQYVIGLLTENGIIVNNTIKAFIESSCKEIDIVVEATKDEILKDELIVNNTNNNE